MSVPQGVKYAIIGAGVHGLSTAFHLAQMLKATGRGSGADILVVDKNGDRRRAPRASPAASSATTISSRPCAS